MATFLYRLGRFSYRRRGVTTLLWALVLAVVGVGAATLSGTMSNSFSMPGTESQKALDLLAGRMPQASADGASARVVFVATSGSRVTATAQATAIQRAVGELKALPHVASVADPFTARTISRDQGTAFAAVTYRVKATDLTSADRDRLFAAGRVAQSAGLRVEFGGDASQESFHAGATEGLAWRSRPSSW